MKVYVNIKQAGKKRAVLQNREYLFPDDIRTLRGVLKYFTAVEVEKYNSKDEKSYFLYEDEKQIDESASEGKVGFGYVYQKKFVVLQQAIENTVQSFNDGLVKVFINDRQLENLDEEIEIKENDIFTFIRFTFLAGRMW